MAFAIVLFFSNKKTKKKSPKQDNCIEKNTITLSKSLAWVMGNIFSGKLANIL